jgi:SAM-dependent methyltransferase
MSDKKHLKNYFEKELGWGTGYQQEIVFDFLYNAHLDAKEGVVLDAGAGSQRYKEFFTNSIYLAQEHPIAGAQNHKIRVYDILSDVKYIPLNDNCVDVVLSTSTLEHMEFPDLFFKEAYRVLKPGGKLYINVPFVYHEHEAPYDFQRPTKWGLLKHYNNCDFENITINPTSSSIYTSQYWLLESIKEEAKRFRNRKILNKLILKTSSLLCDFLMRAYDRGPHEDTKLNIGWVAVGTKKGSQTEKKLNLNKTDFLKSNMINNEKVIFIDNKIVVND